MAFFTSSLGSRNVLLTKPLVPLIALSFDHQNHSKWHKWCHVRYRVALEAFLALAEVSCALDGLINALAVGADAGVPRTVLGCLAAGQGALVADGPVQPHRHAALHVHVQVRHLESIVLFNEEGIVTGTPLLASPVFEGDSVVGETRAPGGMSTWQQPTLAHRPSCALPSSRQ